MKYTVFWFLSVFAAGGSSQAKDEAHAKLQPVPQHRQYKILKPLHQQGSPKIYSFLNYPLLEGEE